MAVRRFIQPDHASAGTDQAGFEDYCGQLEAAIAVLAEQLGQWAPRAADDPAAMTVTVGAGRIATRFGLPAGSATDLRAVAEQTTAALAAPVSAARIDRLWIDATTGSLGVTAGTEGGAAPAIPDGAIPVARVALAVGQTAITNAHLTDERLLGEAPGWGAAAERYTIVTAAGAVAPPAWARWARLTLAGPGGGAGGTWRNAGRTSYGWGGGGGGGALLAGIVVPAQALTVALGTGGDPGAWAVTTDTATDGGDGGETTVTLADGTVFTAGGGKGGKRGRATPAGGLGGAGATAPAGGVAGGAGTAGGTTSSARGLGGGAGELGRGTSPGVSYQPANRGCGGVGVEPEDVGSYGGRAGFVAVEWL